MIVSHTHKYIYLKARKVAGTSVEINLSKFCGKEDSVSTLLEYTPLNDETPYDANGLNPGEFWNHMPPRLIRAKVGEKIWNEYKKIVIVRNPWEVVVSLYWWRKSENLRILEESIKKKLFSLQLVSVQDLLSCAKQYINYRILRRFDKADFALFLIEEQSEWNNSEFYFDETGNFIPDIVLRYEHLEEDYEAMCRELDIEVDPLPRTKTKTRVRSLSVADMFTPASKAFVQEKYAAVIAHFGYTFPDNSI